MSLEKRLSSVFRNSLALGDDVSPSTLEYGKHTAWDSVAHMQLVAGIESEFGLMMDTDDVIAMSSFAKAVEILKRLGVADS